MRTLLLLSITLCLALSAKATTPRPGTTQQPALVENVGQARWTDGAPIEHVDLVLHGGASTTYVHETGMHVVHSRTRTNDQGERTVELYRVDIDLIGANAAARLIRGRVADGYDRILRTGTGAEGLIAQRFHDVTYREVYPGIDERISLTPQGPKVDYIVQPGTSPKQIAFRYSGVQHLRVDQDGNLMMNTPITMMQERAPVAWTQNADGSGKTMVPVRYEVQGASVRFHVAPYDTRKVLVIDPTRVWATYYGGSGSFNAPYTSMDGVGNVFLSGSTITRDLPRYTGAFQGRTNGRLEGYVAKFTWDGKLVWNTYVGSTGNDYVYDLMVDKNGDPWICGSLDSNDHPLVALDPQGSGPYGGLDGDTIAKLAGYVMRLNAATGAWADSWIVDGRENDEVRGIAYANNRLAIVGSTKSPRVMDITGTPYAHNPNMNTNQYDMFISRLILRPNSTNRWTNEWLTYYGGDFDDLGRGVDITATGDVLAMGLTQSENVPVTNGSTFRGVSDIIVTKFATPTPSNPGRAWAIYYGTVDADRVGELRADAQGNAIVVGSVFSNTLPVVAAYQNTMNGAADGFLAKFAAANGQTIYSSYFGGNESDAIETVSLDKSGRIWIAGSTSMSTNLPVTNNAFQAAPHDDAQWLLTDGFMALFSATGANVLYCSYYGAPAQSPLPPFPPPDTAPPPPNTDFGYDLITSIHADQDAYVVTASLAGTIRFSTTDGAYQDSSKLNKDTIKYVPHLTLWSNCPDSAITVIVNGTTAMCPGDERTLLAPSGFAKYLWSTGDTVRSIVAPDSGSYWVICTDISGCRFRDTVHITLSPPPVVSAGADTTGCLNQAIMLTANASSGLPPYRYKWRRVESGPSYIDNDTLRQPSVNPATTSRYLVTITDSAGCTAVDTVLVSVIDPKPTFAPSPIDFGTLDACENARIDSVVITNPMSYPITIASFTPDDPRIELVTSITPPLSLAAGASRTLQVRISPTAVGVTTGTFTVGGLPCDWTLSIPYRVEKARLLATITPGTIDFGTRNVSCENVSRDSSTVIRNGGTEPMTIQPGLVNAPFSMVSPTTETTLQPGDTLRVVFRFQPTQDGAYTEVIRYGFVSGECSDTLRATLRGTRISSQVATVPGTIDIGTLEGCEDEKDTAIVIRNLGTATLTAILPASPEVVFTPAGPITIPVGDSAVVTVTVRPGGTGPFTYDRTITYQPCDVTHPFRVIGTKNGVAFTTPSEISLGEVNTCTDPASTTKAYQISFDGTGSGTVSAVFVGANLTTTLAAGVTLQSGVPQTFDVTWTPQTDGAYVDSIEVVFQPCDVRRVIRVTGTRTTPSLRAVTPVVNLGALATDATGTIRYENNGTDTLFVGATASTGAIVVAQRPTPIEPLLPGQQLEVDYRVVCQPTINDTITATTLGACVLTADTRFTGTCEGGPAPTATVVIDGVEAKVGDRLSVPIRLTQSTGLNANNLTSWEAQITYNPMVVVGSGATPDCFVEGQYTPCTITVTGTRTDSIGVLALLDLTVILGNATFTDLVISKFVFTQDTTVAVTTQNGRVTVTDICEEGGVRLLDPKAEAFSIRVYPQPATTTLTVDVRGMGSQPGTWMLSNYIGQQIADGTITPDAQGNALLQVDVSAYASGTYFLTIDARGTTYRMPVLIQR